MLFLCFFVVLKWSFNQTSLTTREWWDFEYWRIVIWWTINSRKRKSFGLRSGVSCAFAVGDLCVFMLQSPTKAVYNARHWTVDSEEEPPPPFFSRSQTPTVSSRIVYLFMSQTNWIFGLFVFERPPSLQAPVAAGGSSKEPSDAQKDDSVFKAPPPPPKVTKCVTVPTDLYQDQVTALKCRKEHKEVHRTFLTWSWNCRTPLNMPSMGHIFAYFTDWVKFNLYQSYILLSS